MENRIKLNDEEGKVEANGKAIEYLQSIDFKSFGKTVFKDHLATVSETGQSIGELTISVEETTRNEEICYYIHAQSHGELDNVPMGTSVTAYISRGVTTLEQTQHEYIKFPDKPLDKKTVLVKEGNQYIVRRTTTEGAILNEIERIYPTSAMKGFISEGSNIILQRIMCQRQEVPEKAIFTSLDTSLNLAVMKYEKLPNTSLTIENKSLQALGLQREQQPIRAPSSTWHTHFLPDGHMSSRVTLGSPVHMKLLTIPATEEQIAEANKHIPAKKELHWEGDMQLHSHFLDRKEELINNHKAYFRHKPELRALLEDFCQFVLLREPDDVCSFAADYFGSFSKKVKPPTLSTS